MNGFTSKDTFEKMPVEVKLDVLYDILSELYKNSNKRRITDRAIIILSGTIGGFIAGLAMHFWG